MARREHLGEFEQIVLLAVLRLGDDAYGVPDPARDRTPHRTLTHGRCVVPDPRSTRSQRLRHVLVWRPVSRTWRPIQTLLSHATAGASYAAREPRCPGRHVGRARTSGNPWLLTIRSGFGSCGAYAPFAPPTRNSAISWRNTPQASRTLSGWRDRSSACRDGRGHTSRLTKEEPRCCRTCGMISVTRCGRSAAARRLPPPRSCPSRSASASTRGCFRSSTVWPCGRCRLLSRPSWSASIRNFEA